MREWFTSLSVFQCNYIIWRFSFCCPSILLPLFHVKSVLPFPGDFYFCVPEWAGIIFNSAGFFLTPNKSLLLKACWCDVSCVCCVDVMWVVCVVLTWYECCVWWSLLMWVVMLSRNQGKQWLSLHLFLGWLRLLQNYKKLRHNSDFWMLTPEEGIDMWASLDHQA